MGSALGSGRARATQTRARGEDDGFASYNPAQPGISLALDVR